MKLADYVSSLIFICSLGVDAITQDRPIDRPAAFKTLSGHGNFDLSKHDTSLVRVVEPAPLCTLNEMLREHSDPMLKSFLSAHRNALQGKKTMFSSSYAVQAQSYYNILLQDYFPMNEADAAAARFFFSIDECRISTDPKMPTGMTACQYHGARLLNDIVRRVAPIHLVLVSGKAEHIDNIVTPVPLNTPPEWNQQMSKIISMFNTDEVAGLLGKVDANSVVVWNDIRSRTTRNPNSI